MIKNMRRILYKRTLSTLFIAIFVFALGHQSYACTIFNKIQGDKVLVGNNEDWMYSVPSLVWVVASKENTYGRICFANSTYVQGGMNEKGLFYDGASCPISKVPFKEGNKQVGTDLGEIVLSKCANVQEALEMVKGFNIPSSFNDHIMFVDKSGNSAVVEWAENDLRIIRKEGDYQIATNFWLSNTKLGGYPCSRFDKAKQMLEEKKEISISYFSDILNETSQDWGDMGTKYSNVYDLKNMEVYVYYKRNFEKYAKYNLAEELKRLKKGEKKTYKIAELSYQSSNTAVELIPSKPLGVEEKEDTAVADQQGKSDSPENHDRYLRLIKPSIVILSLGIAILLFLFLRRNRSQC